MRKFLSAAAVSLMSVFSVTAQQAPQFTPLPLQQEVKTGKLDNGLTYYILHNEEPKNRANFYIAQKVGSTLETPDQLGLAHFLEHMAFNGTTHYPGHNLLDYLQSKGISFGSDINAYTGFDETVYRINNVPTTDQALMDSVLLALYDWSGSILLEEAEIDAERGVIQEEWRQRNDANVRMYTAILPQLYEEYQYEQMPIGSMEVVMNFKPEALRAYYKKWYRPDQQGIVVVGDFDVDAMEKKVVELFSTIKMPEDAAERTYPVISDNQKPIYVGFEDAELSMARVQTSFKFDRTPKEMRSTVESYLFDQVVPSLISSMLNTRLQEMAQKPDCPFAGAYAYFGTYYVSSQKGSFDVNVVPKGDIVSAYKAAMGLVAQSLKAGFNASELERARQELMANYEKLYNERDKTNSDARAQELIRHFIDGEPAPGIETEYMIAQQVLPNIPVEAYNQIAAQVLHPENVAIVVSQPKVEGLSLPTEETMVNTLFEIINADYEMYVDEVITDPLIAKLPKKGSVKSTRKNEALGTTEFVLSNGVKVVVKPTDFSNDQIVMTAFREGGKESYPVAQAANLNLIGEAFENFQLGPFNKVRLGKYLAGKKVGLGFTMGTYTNTFSGGSTVKDFNTLMELVYAAFTNVSADNDAYASYVSQMKAVLGNQESNPMFVFQQDMIKTRYNDNPMAMPLTVATLEKADYAQMLAIYKEAVANAADYTFIFTGNVDVETIKPLLEQYIASLPSKGKKKVPARITPVEMAKGQIEKEFNLVSQTPTVMVYDCLSQYDFDVNDRNRIMISLLSDIVDMIFIETLREEEGGTYGAQVWQETSPVTKSWAVNWFVQTNPEQQKTIRERAYKEFIDLLNNGAKEGHFAKVKEAALKADEVNMRSNSYWDGQLFNYERGWDYITGHRKNIESITLPEFNAFIKNLYNGKNRIEVVGIAN